MSIMSSEQANGAKLPNQHHQASIVRTKKAHAEVSECSRRQPAKNRR
jgi:hypothetical protein